MLSPTSDFESDASAIPPHQHVQPIYYITKVFFYQRFCGILTKKSQKFFVIDLCWQYLLQKINLCATITDVSTCSLMDRMMPSDGIDPSSTLGR